MISTWCWHTSTFVSSEQCDLGVVSLWMLMRNFLFPKLCWFSLSGLGNVQPLHPGCALGLVSFNGCLIVCPHCSLLSSSCSWSPWPPTSVAGLPPPHQCNPVCTLLPEHVSKEFMSESPFLIEIWASVHLYSHRAKLHETFWERN